MRHCIAICTVSILVFGCGPLQSKQQDKAERAPAQAEPETFDAATTTTKSPDGYPTLDSAPLRRAGYDGNGHAPTQSPFQGELPTLTIDDVTLSGDGCSAGSTAVNVADDANAFTVLFADFVVTLEADAQPGKDGVAHASRRCRAALTLAVPHGYRIAIMTMDYRGFSDLEDGATASLHSGVAFGNQPPKLFDHEMDGPLSEEFAVRDTLTLSTVSYSPCGGQAILNVDMRVSIAAPVGVTGLVALDSADGEITQTYGIAWRRCPI